MKSTRPCLCTDEDLCSAPQQARSLARRQALLDAARDLFAKQGYEGTSVDQIATAAGSASGAFYTYFKSKRQLLLVLMDQLLEQLEALDLTPPGDVGTRVGLRVFLRDVFRTDVAAYGTIRAWQEAPKADAAFVPHAAAVEAWTVARIERVFRQLQRFRNGRADAEVRPFARMMDRHFWSLLATAGTIPPRELDREIRVAADVIHRYLFAT